jgi:hypothetical protein
MAVNDNHKPLVQIAAELEDDALQARVRAPVATRLLAIHGSLERRKRAGRLMPSRSAVALLGFALSIGVGAGVGVVVATPRPPGEPQRAEEDGLEDGLRSSERWSSKAPLDARGRSPVTRPNSLTEVSRGAASRPLGGSQVNRPQAIQAIRPKL